VRAARPRLVYPPRRPPEFAEQLTVAVDGQVIAGGRRLDQRWVEVTEQ
jgi:hypothetical protein